MAGCLLTLVLAILDQNIVTTAAWSIVTDLDPAHGLERLPWLVTAYALAATAALPLYGKLCDVYGAKIVYMGAVGLFVAGSLLCGAAADMTWLIAARAVQGLGGGGLMSVTLVVFAHLVPPQQRAGSAGAGGVLAGLGMVAGPLLGGLLAEHLGWRWIFLGNLPLGLLVLLTAAGLRLSDGGLRHRIDYPGAAIFAAAATGLLLATEWGGDEHAWTSPTILTLGAVTLVLVAAFARRELTAPEPIVPLDLFRDRVMRMAVPVQFLTGFAMIGSVLFAIIYLRAARGVAAADSGLYLIPMAAGMALSGLVSGRAIGRGAPPRTFLLAGLAMSALAMLLLGLLRLDTPLWILDLDLALLGAGFGQSLGILIMLVQNSVPVDRLGVAITSIRFVQTLGISLGSAVFGLILDRVSSASLPSGAPAAVVAGVDAVFLTAAAIMLAALATAAYGWRARETVSGSS
ncbi:EmrB/QacA family drug resistance transporter [Acrocarpospora corrugata]|uniref:EmrB/QacA family drug resistance transporter n=2 Tax=Acrocarpospora corrugata TaxID=35763 RepID=A0A5M3W0W2_9ACTN|nr:EmrB/QacA family drug resistance transporter [Acrocarpospora corrugata]